MAIVSAYARIDPTKRHEVGERIGNLPGATTFDLDEPAKIGVLVESPDLDAAHDLLTRSIKGIEGVQGIWPVFAHCENDLDLEDDTQTAADSV